jgi:transcriptional regulator with XRE-family HTH domain
MKLDQTLKTLLKQRNLTIRELSREVKVSESTIKTWLRGSNPRSLHDVRKCARFFGVSFEFLLFGDEDSGPQSLEEIALEDMFDGWIKIKVQKPIRSPNKKPQS